MDLETTLTKLYSATEITLFFELFLEGVSANKELFLLLGDSWPLNPSKKVIKKIRVEILVKVFTNKKLFSAFYSQLSDDCTSSLSYLVWYGGARLDYLEKILGHTIALKNRGRYQYREPFIFDNDLKLLKMKTIYSSYGSSFSQDQIFVLLPDALEGCLRKVMPKPAAYYINSTKKPDTTKFTHCSADTVLLELTRAVQFVTQGHMGLKKNGGPTIKGLRDLSTVAALKEFYPKGYGRELELLKSDVLASFLLGSDLGKTSDIQTPQVFLRRIFKSFINSDSCYLVGMLLEHLRIKWNSYYVDDTLNIKITLLNIVAELDTESWVSLDTIYNYCAVHQIELVELNLQALEFQMLEKTSYGSWSYWERVTPATVSVVLYQPLLKGFFFLCATLGIVEIYYDVPLNDIFQKKEQEYLSRFDGLSYVKLTQFGSYIIGKTKKYTSPKQKQTSVQFTLDESRLVLTIQGEDPIASLSLEKIMAKVGPGRFMLNVESLYRDCRTKNDVHNKIALFKQTVKQKLPQIWKEFFTTALKKVNPLRPEGEIRVFKITNDSELLRILATDPDITPLIYKVEGLRIAVKQKNMKQLLLRLKRRGYLVTAKSLLA